MSFFELPGLSDVKEKYPVAEGMYDLCIISTKVNEKEGKTNIFCVLEIEGQPDAANVLHNVSMIGPDDDDDKKKAKMLFLARFLHQFGINADAGLETEQMVGSRATACKLTQEEYPENSGQIKNNYNPSQLPREEA